MQPYHRDERSGITLYHGDSLRVLTELGDNVAAALVTDPPYSSGGQFRGDRSSGSTSKYINTENEHLYADFSGDNRDARSFAYWVSLWLAESLRVTRPGSPGLLFADWRQVPSVTDAFQSGGWVWRGLVTWDKTGASRPVKGRFAPQCEFVVWGSNGPMPMNREAPCLPGIFTHSVDRQKRHATAKPVGLMLDLAAIVEPGGVVLDPFAGSGTTLVAAKRRGLPAIGIEYDEHHCETIANRLEAEPAPLFSDAPTEVQSSLFAGEDDAR